MERKLNELEIKQTLLSKLSEIIMKDNDDDTYLIKSQAGNLIMISKKYDTGKFRFTPGQFIQMSLGGCPFDDPIQILLCVGVGKGCPKSKEREMTFGFFRKVNVE